MKKLFCIAALSSLGLAIPLLTAQSQSARRAAKPRAPFAAPTPKLLKTLRGEAFFLERIALPPRARLYVSLVGRVAGAENLPLATTILPAKAGITPFKLQIPAAGVPIGPYRLQAWIIGDNRALFAARGGSAPVASPEKFARIRLDRVPAPQNIDGIGDGKPLPMNQNPAAPQTSVAPQTPKLRGTVSKLDRRALSPDSRLEIQLRDVSLADGPAPLVLGQNIQLDGAQLPRAFELTLLPTDLQPRRRYALSARVYEAGKLTYITNTLIEVSPENVGKPFELRVVSAAPTP